ncbi:MAG: hypothetical protein ACK5KP_08700 [Paludibacteraceae bacterium]
MKTLRNVFLLILIVLSAGILAQNDNSALIYGSDSIKKEILSYADTQSQLITKGRRLLLDRFTEGDLRKVKEVKDYLKLQVETRDYLVLYPFEHWLILYWTKEYPELLNLIKNPDAFEYAGTKRIKPSEDILFDRLKEKSLSSLDKLMYDIRTVEMPSDDKDFLILYLNAILSGEKSEITQDRLNELSDGFLKNHPNSEYNDFIRENIRYKYIPSKWGLAYEFFSGYGWNEGNLNHYFKSNVPIGIAFDVQYKNLSLYLRNYIGFSKTRQDILSPNGFWFNDSQVRVYIPEASLGYVAYENHRFKLAPFAGIGGVDFSPTEADVEDYPYLKDADIGGFSYTAGLNLDVKLGNRANDRNWNFPTTGFGFIRLRYSYVIPQISQKHDVMTGNMHYITIGIGAFGRNIKRDK